MAIRTRRFNRHCDHLTISTSPYRPCPQSPRTSPQRDRNTKARGCRFFYKGIDYLDHVILSRCLEIAAHTKNLISEKRITASLTDLKSFLRFCYVLRRFFPNFARLVAPLNKWLRKEQTATFEPSNQKKLKSIFLLEQMLIFPLILALPNSTGHITLEMYARNIQVGCVLLQKQPDKETMPTGYWSRFLTEAERKYNTAQRKYFAKVRFVLLVRPYLK